MQTRSGFSARSRLRSSHGDEGGAAQLRSWATSPSVTFSLLLSRFDERFPRGTNGEGLDDETSFSQDEEFELELGEEESTESEPEPEPMEEEFDGVLDEEMTAEALHKLGRSAPGTEHVYLSLSLSDRRLSDISVLCKYIHLEKLDLSCNKINDLSCVSHMPYLLELNASQNELITYFDFKPPKNLQVVNFSHNKISAMKDLSAYQSLAKLILDNNEIEEIRGLEKCHSLTYLSLANNKITAVTGLRKLPIKTLCLKSNQITKAAGLEELKVLQILDLSGNQISSLEGLEEHNLLEEINLKDNQVAELGELEYIETLPLLRVFNLLNNPVRQHRDYWLLVIFMLLRLTELDHKKITVQEKVAAVNKYDPPPEVVAAQDHMTQIMYSMMQPQRIFDSTLPSLEAPYPMLVLTGPLACWKRELCHRLCRKFNNYFRYSPCHTTRTAYFGEENRLDYYFVSQEEFDKMVNTGKFIASFKYSSFYYGLGRDTIESIAREGLATCVHLEIECWACGEGLGDRKQEALENKLRILPKPWFLKFHKLGVRSLKNSYFEPRYILLIPMNKEKYGGHLRRKGLFSRAEIDEAICRVDMYIKLNQDFPGFFDAVINVDDYDEAFTKLSYLIEEFLGLKQPSETEVTVPASNSNLLTVPDETPSALPKATTVKGTDGVAPLPTPNAFMDSSAKNYSAVISAKLSAQKTPVLQMEKRSRKPIRYPPISKRLSLLWREEEASLQRRQRTAKQGLVGKAVSSYSQLFQRDFASTSGAVGVSHARFLEPTPHLSTLPTRTTTSPDRGIPPTSPDQSSKDARATPGAPLISSPRAFSSMRPSFQTPVANVVSSAESNDDQEGRKEVTLPPDTKEKKTPKPKPTSPLAPQVVVRPGSNTKPVLPPIPSGRKRNKPSGSDMHTASTMPSPKPSP